MAKSTKAHTPDDFMRMSIELMKLSKPERRSDGKVSPSVGAVLVLPNGEYFTSYRGELREGDHAEFTVIERKCGNLELDGATIYVTLEPCAPDTRNKPKVGCSKRITNARISTVYIGIEDPDPNVARKGIQHLLDCGVEVNFYPRNLADEISSYNKDFLIQAKERAEKAEKEDGPIWLSEKEKIVPNAELDDLNEDLLDKFRVECKIQGTLKSSNTLRQFEHIGILSKKNNTYHPTGLGLLLFGKNPQLKYPNAVVRMTVSRGGFEDVKTVEGPLVNQPVQIEKWIKDNLRIGINRTNAVREDEYEFPLEAVREITNNALVHRDYDIDGAPIQIELNEKEIVIKSPGAPVKPITVQQIADFSAPTLSRNPKIIYVFDKFGLAEQRGLGFKTMRSLPDKYHAPLPHVDFKDPYLIITMPLHYDRKTNNDEDKIYDYIKINGLTSKKEVVAKFSLPNRTAERLLKQMIEQQKIVKEGDGPSTKYRIW